MLDDEECDNDCLMEEDDEDDDSSKREDIYDSYMDMLEEEPEDSNPCYGWDDFPFNRSSESNGLDWGWCMLGRIP